MGKDQSWHADSSHVSLFSWKNCGVFWGEGEEHGSDEEPSQASLNIQLLTHTWGFPGSSVGKESACHAGDPSSIPGSERSAGDGTGYPLQYSWASLVGQLVKNLPAMWETCVPSLGLGRSPGEGKGYPLQYSGLENPMDRIVHEVSKSRIGLSDFHFPFPLIHGVGFKETEATAVEPASVFRTAHKLLSSKGLKPAAPRTALGDL